VGVAPVPALSTMFSVPETAPVAVGEKLTAIVHDAPPPANELPQVVCTASTANTLLLVVMLLIVMVPAAVLALLLVTVINLSGLVVPCRIEPKLTVVGESVRTASDPMPFSAIVAGLLLESLTTLTLPVSVPWMLGVKVNPTVHEDGGGVGPVDPEGPSVVVPLRLQGLAPTLLRVKSPAVGPVLPDAVMLLIVIWTGVGLLLVTVAVLTGVLCEPTTVAAHDKAAETVIAPGLPVPLSVTMFGLLAAVELTVSVPEYDPWAEAVKVIPTVHELPLASPGGANVVQVSAVVWKFGDGEMLTGPLGVCVVVVTKEVMVIGPPD